MEQDSLDGKLARMEGILRSLRRVAVAFSGGVDSTFVLKVAVDTLGPDNVLAVIGDSASLSPVEKDEARALAGRIGVELVEIRTAELENSNYFSNPPNRCYFCKSAQYDGIEEVMARRGFAAAVNGINADDYEDWRPGIQAAREHNVRSPCAEAGMTKADIRALSRRMGLPTFDKPAMPCLASRVPYGQTITADKLRQIDAGEQRLRALGFRESRVRHHGDLARIELPADDIARATAPEMRARIDEALRAAGFHYVAIDLRGFRSGSLNEVLARGPQDRPAKAAPPAGDGGRPTTK